jgi:hypothetical protein
VALRRLGLPGAGGFEMMIGDVPLTLAFAPCRHAFCLTVARGLQFGWAISHHGLKGKAALLGRQEKSSVIIH